MEIPFFVKYGHWSGKKHSIKLGALQPIQNLGLSHIVNTCWKTRTITEVSSCDHTLEEQKGVGIIWIEKQGNYALNIST